MRNDLIRRYVARSLPIVATLALASPAAYAWDFQNDDGTFSGSWDTTFTYGQAWRIESRDCRLIAIADGGCGRSPNIDDGNLNYGTDMYSRALKVLTELSLNYRGVGAFVRASGLYDDAANNTQRTPLSDKSEDLVVSYTRLLDAFVYAKFDLGDMGAELRLGRQVVSWGESTFIQNGINVINHFDVSALRVPGSELKEGFLPQEMVNFSLQFNDNCPRRLSTSPTGTRRCPSRRVPITAPTTSRRPAAARWCSASVRSPTRAWTSGRSAARTSPTSRP